MKNLRYFRYAIGLSVLMFAFLYYETTSFALLWTALVLSVMELAVSFDNALVNAKVMERMTPFWRQAFITVGIFIAVFGMRFYLPIQIVSWLGGLSLGDATRLAFSDSAKFAEILISSHAIVSGFGGAFLLMIFLKYFISEEKHEEGKHWIPGVEPVLAKLGGVEEIHVLIAGAAVAVTSLVLGGDKGITFLVAGIAGIGAHIVVDILKASLEKFDEYLQERAEARGDAPAPGLAAAAASGTKAVAATGGLGMFLYLEVFDASMSFDGVIAAFAITNNILVVAVGLGVGAVFVRSLTLLFYDTKSLANFRYLEMGAFWAIGGLALFMFASVVTHVPELAISAYGGLVIFIAFIHSVIANKRDPQPEEAAIGHAGAVEARA